MTTEPVDGEHLRTLAPQVLAAVVRRYGHFDAAEDAVQEALLAATVQWPAEGTPRDRRAWLITVASRRLIDRLRTDTARRRREEAAALTEPALHTPVAPAGPSGADAVDDTLLLLFLCCHPALTTASQIALTLRAVGGLTTAEIARAFLVPETTMGQRISRAKEGIRSAGSGFAMPPEEGRAERLAAVLHVLYLIFNEGSTASGGPDLLRPDLSAEAIRLGRQLHQRLPDEGEVAGLLALMLLTDARRPARTSPGGDLIPLADQDRTLWDRTAIAEGTALVADAMGRRPVGPYQLQAAIAAVHAEAADATGTDWDQIVALYRVLDRIVDNPMVTLNHAVAVAMARGPAAGLTMLAELDGDRRIRRHHRLHAVRAHLLDESGDTPAAAEAYREAVRLATSLPERRYLERRLQALGGV